MGWLTQKAFLELYTKVNFYLFALGEFGRRKKLAQFRREELVGALAISVFGRAWQDPNLNFKLRKK